MKKKTIILSVLAAILIAGICIAFIFNSNSCDIASGKYVADNKASINVEKNRIQFFDIDLNELLQESAIKKYAIYQSGASEGKLDDETVKEYSDYNKMFVEASYKITKEPTHEDDELVYFLDTKLPLGYLIIRYNPNKQVITLIVDKDNQIKFTKV